jgi:hypothetical protein
MKKEVTGQVKKSMAKQKDDAEKRRKQFLTQTPVPQRRRGSKSHRTR